ncbi:MAG: hypothetical protein D6748_09400 [Calditrichaeota bacterium]|nr:MAG: hypothetical protein D6748_09400 [Calditrichota bacterium]
MKRGIFVALSILLLMLYGCKSSNEPVDTTPQTGSVSGTVTFVGTWPTTGEIQVGIYANLQPPYIPMGPPEAFTDPIPQGTMVYNYKLEGLEKGTYSAIYVSWRDPNNPAASKILGMYWDHPDSVGIDTTGGFTLPVAPPKSVTIDDQNLNLTNIDIKADLDL